MVAIFTGAGTGFERGSGTVIGGAGLLGSAAQGRGGDNIFLNAANGNLLISRQDEFLSGRGPDLGISRTYNSLGNFSDDNGDNWRQSTDRRVFGFSGTVNTAGSYVMRRGADGAEVKYSWNGSAYVATDGAGSYDTLTYNGDWTWTDGDSRITEVYTSFNSLDWQIVSQTDTSGNSLTFSYTGANLTRVTTANGEYTEFGWSGNNLIQLVTGYSEGGVAKTLTRTRYGYDLPYNRLSTVTVDLTPTNSSDNAVYTTTYTYHGTSKLVASISQTDGSYAAFAYDGSGRVDSIAQTVASGVTRTTIIAYGAGTTTVTDPMGQVVTLYYDGAGQLTQITSPPAHAGAAAQIVQFGYNSNGDLTSVTDAAGQAATYTHDANGNVLTATDRLGNTVTRTYNAANQVLTEMRSGAPLKISSGVNATAVLQPDGLYRITKTGGTENTWLGQTQSSTAIDGDFVLQMRPLQSDKALLAGLSLDPNATNSYPDIGFAIYPGFSGNLYALENGIPTQIGTYGANDNLWMVRTGGTIKYYKGTTLAQAELAGPLRTVTGAAGTFYFDSSFYSMGAQADVALTEIAVDRYVYDNNNRLKYVVSAEGHVRTSYYDAYGQIYATEEYANFSYDLSGLAPSTPIQEWEITALLDVNNHPTNKFIQYAYDDRGNLSQKVDYNGVWSTAGGYSHHYYTFDQAGQLLNRVAATQNTEHFVYDGLGRMTSSTDLNGGVTSIVFNDAATQTIVTLAGGLVQTSVYNKAGELVSLSEAGAYTAGGTASYAYDQNGRLRVATDASGGIRYYLYDKAGRKTAEVNPDGNLIEYRYDSRNRLVATARFGLRVSGDHLAQLADPNWVIDIETIRPQGHAWDVWTWHVYDADGRVLQAIEGDGSTTTYDYNASGQLVRTTGYYNKLSPTQIEAFQAAAPTAVALPPAHANDTVSRVFYDKDGRIVGTLDGLGYLTRTIYDKAGRKVQDLAYTNLTSGALRATGTFQQLIASVNASAADRSMRYVYDGQGLLRYQIDGLGYVTEFRYESEVAWGAIGPVRATTILAAPISFSSFSFAAVKAAIASAGAASNPANRTSWGVYDTAGRVAYAINAGGAVTGYSYDSSGRVTRQVQYATLRPTSALPTQADMDSWAAANLTATDRITRNYYTARGELRFVVDAEGYVTRNDYDAEGRLLSAWRWDTPVAAADWWDINTVNGAVGGSYSGKSQSYGINGRIDREYDGEGNNRFFAYYANGLLAWEITSYGTADERRVLFEYDAAGNLARRFDAWNTPEQGITHYAYDGLGNLTSVTDPLNRTTTYTHDSLGRVLTETNAASGTVSYQYNAFGEVVRTTDQRGNSTYNYYDTHGRVIASRDAENYVTQTSYTAFGEIESVTRHYNKATNPASADTLPLVTAHAQDAVTSYAYDRASRVTSIEDAENYVTGTSYTTFGEIKTVTRNAASTHFIYDRLGRVTRSTDDLGNYEEYTLDAAGNRIAVRNKLGGITTNTYDRRGLLIEESISVLTRYEGPDGPTTTATIVNKFEYDTRGNLIKSIEADNAASASEKRVTVYAYDKNNRLTLKKGVELATGLAGDLVTPEERYVYDKSGNLIETRIETVAGSIRSVISRTLFYYDNLNRKVAQIDPAGAVIQYSYDAAGNLTSTRAYDKTLISLPLLGEPLPLPDGSWRDTFYDYDKLGRRTKSYKTGQTTGYWNGSAFIKESGEIATLYEYDAAGNIIKTTDPNGATTYSYYDRLGRRTHEVDRENYLTKWEYDAEGNVLTERRYAKRWDDPVTITAPPAPPPLSTDRVTEFSYDTLGRRLTETRVGVEAWTINSETGQLTAASGDATIAYAYNELGQVLSKTEANGDLTSYRYDTAGRLIYEKRQGYLSHEGAWVSPSLYYYYNGLDQLVATRQNGASLPDRLTSNTYVHGRLTATTDASGFTRNYHYDAAGRLVAESYARMLSPGYTILTAMIYEYDAAGRVITQTYAQQNGTSWVHTDFNGDTYDATRMRYNAHGELTGRAITAGLVPIDPETGYRETYDYDAAGRVWRTNAGDGAFRLSLYDKAGNQTVSLISAGAGDFRTSSYSHFVDTLIPSATSPGYLAVVTFTVYDKRGMAIATVEPGRQLSASLNGTILREREYNAFGEVTKESNPRLSTGAAVYTTFVYNTMGRLVTKVSPQVSVTGENGLPYDHNPTEHYRYDISGRLIGAVDANGNTTARALLAGTGHGGSEALVTRAFNADGLDPDAVADDHGVVQTFYDVFGDARIIRNQLGYTNTSATYAAQTDERYSYDAMGRVTSVTRRGGQLIDRYEYDQLGQRLKHWLEEVGTSTLGTISAYVERADYDAQGRIFATVAMGGDSTATRYVWDGAIVTEGLGTFGGWKQTTTYSNGRTSIEHSDMFDHVVWKQDLGSNVTSFTFDRAGRQTAADTGSAISNLTYFNTGQIATISGPAGTASYGYDAAGNRLSEKLFNGSATLKDQTATYDALGRLKSWSEAGSATSPAASTSHEYDANGNIRRTQVSQSILNASGGVASTQTKDHWFSFDSMNRLVIDKGQLSGAAGAAGTIIVRGATGSTLTYDAAGQRKTSTQTRSWSIEGLYYYGGGSSMFSGENGFYTADIFEQYQYYSGYWSAISGYPVESAVEESYQYSATGNLLSVRQKKPNVIVYGSVTVDNDNPVYSSTSQFTYDALGRQTYQHDYAEDGVTVVFQRTATYNAKGQMLTDDSYTIRTDGYLYRSVSEYSYTDQTTGEYLLGAVGVITTTNYRNGIDDGSNGAPDPQTVYHYRWFDAAMQSSSTFDSDTDYVTNPIYTTNYNYNAFGQLTSIGIGGDKSRTVTFTNDELGRVIRRDESNISGQVGAPHEVWYHFGGRQMGYTGNNGTDDLDYVNSVYARQTRAPDNPGTFRNSSTGAYSHADFVNSSDPINSYSQGSTAGRYTARAGDTLASIAAQIYGDASLAYKVAQANGMSTGVSLIEGQSLTLPSGVMRNTYNASTFKPYDPSEVVGDLSPTLPKPPKKKGCGVLGQVLMMVVAIAVTAILKTPVAKLFAGLGKVGGAIATGATLGAVSNVASQGFGVAAGIQDKFNWGAVGLAAVSGGIGGGMGAQFENGILGKVSGSEFVNNFANTAAFGAVHGVISQGIGVATGLQHKFDWAGVAAGAVGGGLSTAVGGGRFVAPAVDGIASAAARSLITGTSFGDNIIAVLPGVIGRTIGGMIERAIAGGRDTSGAPETTATASSQESAVPYVDTSALDPWTTSTSDILGSPLPSISGAVTGSSSAGSSRSAGYDGEEDVIVITRRLSKSDRAAIAAAKRLPAYGAFEGASFGGTWNQAFRDMASWSGSQVQGWAQSMQRDGIKRFGAFNHQGTRDDILAQLTGDPFGQAVAIAALSPVAADPANPSAGEWAETQRQIEALRGRESALATAGVDKPILLYLGGVAGGSGIAGLGTIAAGGYSGFAALSINVGSEGLAAGVQGFGIRGALGGENTLGTFATDSAFGVGSSLLLRGAAKAGGYFLSKIGPAAERSIAGGAANRTGFEAYKDSLRAGMEKPLTSDPRLSSILDDLYRPNATVGSGSTAAAVRQELATGTSVGGKMHSQKAADSIRALEKWLERNPTARPGDRAAAENVIKDTRNALGW